MNRAKGFYQNCTGCGACYAICPVHAITMTQNEKGFYSAVVQENCVDCGRCGKVCQISLQPEKGVDFQEMPQYGAFLKDENIHRGCASGGVAYGLYKTAMAEGRKAIGTYYDPLQNRAVTGISDTLEGVKKFRGSKYLQGMHWEALNTALHSEYTYIVCGTPCEVYGFRKAAQLNHCEDRFLFIDIFCHGVPSYLAWDQYITETTGNVAVKDVTFRDHDHGWKKYVLSVCTEQGRISSSRSQNPFYHIFDDSYLMSDSCYQCKMCQRYGYSDIRIGDLWNPSLCQDGIFKSIVCIGSKQGQAFWNQAKVEFQYFPVNVPLINCNTIPQRWTEIQSVAIKKLQQQKTLKATIRAYRSRENLKRRLIRSQAIVKGYIILKRIIKGDGSLN